MTLASLADAEVALATAARVARPRQDPADSFVLHAPLELAARLGLLAWVRPAERDAARRAISDIGDRFEAFGPAAEPAPPLDADVDGPASAAAYLDAAVRAGDLDAADAAALALARHATVADLGPLLAGLLVPSLAAAGHAPIFLHLMPRVAPRGELPVALIRPLVRELARNPDWRLTWFAAPEAAGEPAPGAGDGGSPDLGAALRDLPHLGINGSPFIYPTMHQVEASGVAAAHLGAAVRAASPLDAGHTILRLAAQSMLVENDDHVPYGWSHALTMPQAVLSVLPVHPDPRHALAVAATFLAGFRTSLGHADLTAGYDPEPPAGNLTWALATHPASAPAAVWHSTPTERSAVITTLATAAAVHHDAHVAKYTLACIDAATADPTAARLYLAAAARLLAFWITHPDAGFAG
jgi:hypothetical protein